LKRLLGPTESTRLNLAPYLERRDASEGAPHDGLLAARSTCPRPIIAFGALEASAGSPGRPDCLGQAPLPWTNTPELHLGHLLLIELDLLRRLALLRDGCALLLPRSSTRVGAGLRPTQEPRVCASFPAASKTAQVAGAGRTHNISTHPIRRGRGQWMARSVGRNPAEVPGRLELTWARLTRDHWRIVDLSWGHCAFSMAEEERQL
jgi:hypothetical protein